MGLNLNLIGLVAAKVGVAEPAMRLLFSVFCGYPIAYIYQKHINGKSPSIQNVYFLLTGLYLGYYNYGIDILHCAVNVLITYAAMLFLGPTRSSIAVVFTTTMVYLLYGYLQNTGTDGYDFTFTMPLCVLVLRLIGLTFNYYDGNRDQEKLSKDMKEAAIKKLPSILEVFGFAFFPTGFLIGPQFPILRYQNLISGKFNNIEKADMWSFKSSFLRYALKRAAFGLFYIGVYHVGSLFVSDDFMISDELNEHPFWKKCIFLGIYGRLIFYKYISIWLIGEGASVMFGLGYDGKDKDGNLKLDKMANINIKVFENATNFIHYVDSFNVNTNMWVLTYVYKRLKFMNNKYISQGAVLLFLAVWHGIHSGYYATFFMEFLVVTLEKDIMEMTKRHETFLEYTSSGLPKAIVYILLKTYTFVFIGYCNGPFSLLTYHKWLRLYRSYYYLGHIIFVFWPIYRIFFVKYVFPPKRESKKSS